VFEDRTFETILEEMLNEIPDEFDKREGSPIYLALAPAAAKLSEAYVALDRVLDLVFAETSEGEYLQKRVREQGIIRKSATKTIRHAQTTGYGIIPAGTRFLIGDSNYFVSTNDSSIPGTIKLESEESGSHTVVRSDEQILPLDTIDGLEAIVLVDHPDDENGVDEESDHSLLERYWEATQETPASGNKADYVKWAKEVPGVGEVKVIPLRDGSGLVKLIILDANGAPANQQLIENVKNYIDPTDGDGDGKAPIGARIIVEAAKGKTIDISVSIELDHTVSIEFIQDEIEKSISSYLSSLSFGEVDEIRINKIGSIIINTKGVLDYSGLTLNNDTRDIIIEPDEVPVLGVITISEI
jgi:uncharacterized phage protein gp47/JayE